MILDVETTVTLQRVFNHILETEAKWGRVQELGKAREILSALLEREGASAEAIALRRAETKLAETIRFLGGTDEAVIRSTHQEICAVEEARFTYTLEQAFGTEPNNMVDIVEKATSTLFDEQAVRTFVGKAKALLQRHHGFTKES